MFDGDNNLELCVNAPEGTTFSTVNVAAGSVYDPAPAHDPSYQDDLTANVNALTEIAISP